MNLSFKLYDEITVIRYINDLKDIEKTILYPLKNGKDFFRISHGSNYTPFFINQGFKSKYLIIKDGNTVIGGLVGVWKKVKRGKKEELNILYIADLKLKKKYRGKKIIKKALFYLLIRWPLKRNLQGWDFIYFCAMQKDNFGVEKTFKGFHIGRFSSKVTEFVIYMTEPRLLKKLPSCFFKTDKNKTINLSEKRNEHILWNKNIKEIVLDETDERLSLGHINPDIFEKGDEKRFEKSIKIIEKKKNSLACFAIDTKQKDQIKILEQIGIKKETVCKLFIFNPFLIKSLTSVSFYISTGEI